jgi:hypothetical protein
MKADISALGVTELTPEEASATSGGVLWAVGFAIVGVVGLAAAAIGGYIAGGPR